METKPVDLIENNDLVILYSGGSDSRLLLEFALKLKKIPICLLIDYGQVHQEELKISIKSLIDLNIKHELIKINNFNINSGLTGDGKKGTYEGVHERHVPGRNSIFLSLALSLAESRNIDTIWIGSDWSDRLNLFPDCYQEYIVKINELFQIAGSKPVKVEAPLMGFSKDNVLGFLESLNIKKEEYFSGYGNH